MADDGTLDDKINKIFSDKFKKELSDTEKRLAKLIPDKKTFKSLYFSEKSGKKLGGAILLDKLLRKEKTLLSLQIETVKKKTENVKKVADAENKLQKEIVKDIKIEQNNRKKQTFINNALQKDSIKRNYKANAWLSNIFKNTPINRNLPSGQRPPIQNNKNTPFIISDMLDINTPQLNMMGTFSNKPVNSNKTVSQQQSQQQTLKNRQEKHEADLFAKALNNTHKQEKHEQKLNDSKKAFNASMFGKAQAFQQKQQKHQAGMFGFAVNLANKQQIHDINTATKTQTLQQKKESHDASMFSKAQTASNRDETHKASLFSKAQVIQNRQEMHQATLATKTQANNQKKQAHAQNIINKQQLHNIKKQGLFQTNLNKQQLHNVKLQQTNILFEKKLQQMRNEEFKRFIKGLMTVPKNISMGQVGYGGLGLLGAGFGGLLGGIPSILTQATGGVIGGAGRMLGKAGLAIGAGLGLKGLFGGNKGLQTVPTQAQSKVGGTLGKIGGILGGFGGGTSKVGKMLRPLGKYGAMAGAGATKLGGKAGVGLARGVGKIFGKIPGIGMITKIVPGLNTVLAAGAIGYGIYDAWNSTDNTADFLKESAWNTGGNLISMATMGIISADEAKAFGKDMAGKVQNSQMYKDAKDRAEKYIKGSRPYKTFYGEENPNIKILENARKKYQANNILTRDEMTDSELYQMNRFGIMPKRENKESLPDYFWNNRTALKSKNNLMIPSWVKDTRGQLTDNFKNVKLGGDLFNMGSTNSIQNKNTTTNNNSVVNVYNEPQQNKTTPVMAFGGHPLAVLGF